MARDSTALRRAQLAQPSIRYPVGNFELQLKMSCIVERLAGLCENYIVEHFEEFPVSSLSLLPLSRRKDLLWRLPIADVCLRLENTDFVKGLDMAAYWKFPCANYTPYLAFPKDKDIERYITERWPSEDEYAKAWLYGQVATGEIGWLPDDYEFALPQNGCTGDDDPISFLYGVRNHHGDEWDRLTYPHRYQQMEKLSLLGTSKEQEQDIVDAIVHSFRGEHPKMLPEVQLLKDSEVHHGCDLSDADLWLLSEVEYVGIQCRPFDPSCVEWIIKLLNKAANLQVLVLQGCNVPNDQLDLDDFCEQLATCQPFWSKFQILKIVAGIPEIEELKEYGVDTPEEYTVSQDSLDQLITAYLSAPTDHSQLVQFSYTHIECQDTNCNPPVDRTSLQFKNIRLSDCRFDSNKATPEAISKWLGQRIEVLEKDEETHSFLFQIDHKDSVLGQKRKYSEVHSEKL